MDPLLTVPEVARLLRISRSKAYALVQRELPHVKIGANVRVKESDLAQYVQACTVPAPLQ